MLLMSKFGPKPKDAIEYAADSIALDDNDCLLWLGALDRDGYGSITIRNQPSNRAHRFIWYLHELTLIAGLHLDHLCRVRNCVAPWHLEQVSSQENTARGVARRIKATHCPLGHEYTPENTRYRQRPERHTPDRVCRACNASRSKEWRQTNEH